MSLLPHTDRAITGITCDSRQVQPGFIFAALPGSAQDGRAFIPAAIAAGARFILAEPGTVLPVGSKAELIANDNPRRALALMAAEFYGNQPAIMTAVTGTNGKTSTAEFTRQIWAALGYGAASIGTLGIIAPHWPNQGGLTTPAPEVLQANLAKLAEMGVDHACIEASSHGLTQYRLDGVALRAAAFTNLTRDHLDYHGDMASYGRAKQRLFSDLLPADGVAVINADSPDAEPFLAVARERGLKGLSFGHQGQDIRLNHAIPNAAGQHLELIVLGQKVSIDLPLAGTFQAWNVLTALGLVLATGGDQTQAIKALGHLTGVPGRLQLVAQRRNGASIYVDYAHTPDALQTVLAALRPHVTGKGQLVCLFGCGGDRDPGKRPQMGAIAQAQAERVIVTDDNPRSEDASLIRQAILAACPKAREIPDRAQAIATAIAGLQSDDVLVLAGKGHEQGQIVGKTILPFDDAQQARQAVAGEA